MKDRDYMALTPADRRVLRGPVMDLIREALDTERGDVACKKLEQALDALQRITRRQWWSIPR